MKALHSTTKCLQHQKGSKADECMRKGGNPLFLCLADLSSGGFFRMKVLRRWRMSTSEVAPHALHLRKMKSFLILMVVSGLPHE